MYLEKPMMTVNCRESCGCARGRCEEKRLGIHHLCFDAIWLEIRRGKLAAAPATTATLPPVISSQSVQNNFRKSQTCHFMTCENCRHGSQRNIYCFQPSSCIWSCISRTQSFVKVCVQEAVCPEPCQTEVRSHLCFRRQWP